VVVVAHLEAAAIAVVAAVAAQVVLVTQVAHQILMVVFLRRLLLAAQKTKITLVVAVLAEELVQQQDLQSGVVALVAALTVLTLYTTVAALSLSVEAAVLVDLLVLEIRHQQEVQVAQQIHTLLVAVLLGVQIRELLERLALI